MPSVGEGAAVNGNTRRAAGSARVRGWEPVYIWRRGRPGYREGSECGWGIGERAARAGHDALQTWPQRG